MGGNRSADLRTCLRDRRGAATKDGRGNVIRGRNGPDSDKRLFQLSRSLTRIGIDGDRLLRQERADQTVRVEENDDRPKSWRIEGFRRTDWELVSMPGLASVCLTIVGRFILPGAAIMP